MVPPHFCLFLRNKVEMMEKQEILIAVLKVQSFNAQTDKIHTQKGKLGSLINKETMRDEIDLDAELDRVDDDSRDENLCKELIVKTQLK